MTGVQTCALRSRRARDLNFRRLSTSKCSFVTGQRERCLQLYHVCTGLNSAVRENEPARKRGRQQPSSHATWSVQRGTQDCCPRESGTAQTYMEGGTKVPSSTEHTAAAGAAGRQTHPAQRIAGPRAVDRHALRESCKSQAGQMVFSTMQGNKGDCAPEPPIRESKRTHALVASGWMADLCVKSSVSSLNLKRVRS